MAVNAFLKFSNSAEGESRQKGFEKWIELQGWDWEIEAESSWTKGGGASVGVFQLGGNGEVGGGTDGHVGHVEGGAADP